MTSQPLNILAFDTCFSACSVAVGRDVGGPSQALEAFFEPRDVGHAEALMPMIRQAMRAARLGFKDIERIGVTFGPGTFTGTRIGISAARALHLATGVPLVGASSLAVMAEDAIDMLGVDIATGERAAHSPPVLIAVDARRGQVYTQLFGKSGLDPLTAPQVITIAEAARLGGDGALVIAGSGAEAVAEVARALGRDVTTGLPRLQPDASSLVDLVAALPIQTGPLTPLYLREADAKPGADMAIARH